MEEQYILQEIKKKYKDTYDNIIYQLIKENDKLKKNSKLKLFVWCEFCPNWNDGLAFAIAENANEAMKLIEEDRGFEIREWGDFNVYPLDSKIAKSVSGGS